MWSLSRQPVVQIVDAKMAASDIVKEGYVKFQTKRIGVWKKKWLMLRRRSGKGPVRLEKYKDEETAAVLSMSGGQKKIIDLTRVERVERLTDAAKKHRIGIVVDAFTTIQFCASSDMEAEMWTCAMRDEMNPENRSTQGSFSVYLLPNSNLSTSGECTLQISETSLRLSDRTSGRNLAVWPLNGLRKYGVERNMFTIEAGRSCPTGEGTFIFDCDDSNLIYQRVHALTQASTRTSTSTSSEGSTPRTPNGLNSGSFSMSNWGNPSSIQALSRQRSSRRDGGDGGGGGGDRENSYNIDRDFSDPPAPQGRSSDRESLPPPYYAHTNSSSSSFRRNQVMGSDEDDDESTPGYYATPRSYNNRQRNDTGLPLPPPYSSMDRSSTQRVQNGNRETSTRTSRPTSRTTTDEPSRSTGPGAGYYSMKRSSVN